MQRVFPILATAAACLSASALHGQIEFSQNSTVILYGNSMVERLCEHGEMEAWIQLAHPGQKLRFRSLAWTGDEVGYRLRPEGYVEHLKKLHTQWPAQVVVAGFGLSESFRGESGLGEFKTQLEDFLRELQRIHAGAKIVLLTSTAVEAERSPEGVDAKKRNADLALYAAAIHAVGGKYQALVVDLFQESFGAYAKSRVPLTSNGLHLNEAGNRWMGRWIAQQLVGEAALARVDATRIDEVAKAAALKTAAVADVVRPKNAVVYFGVRKRPEEYEAEIPRYHQLVEAADATLHGLVNHPERHLADFPAPTLPPPAPSLSKPAAALGVIKLPADQQQDILVADGFELNLFASETEFPLLKNPVQMAFDAQGRLWVVTMPSWPHTFPGDPHRDKILILEDRNRDGKADQCTVFADGFNALDGVAFHETGVIVSAQPRLLVLQDTDGDGKADAQRELFRGIDVTDSHHGGMIATDPMGHVLFCDGVFHRSQFETPFGSVRGVDATTYLLEPRTGKVWTEWQSQTPNPWKMTFNRQGSPLQMYGDGLVLDGLQLTWTPLGAYHPFSHGKTLGYGKGSGAQTISSPNFPDDYQQGMASATLLGRYFVALSKYNADSGPFVATDRVDVLRSENPAFRPVDLAFGMDGGLYVSDFCSKIIGHAQHPMRDPLWNHEHGRIWRVISKLKPVVKDWPRIEGASVPELLALLRHPQDLVREHTRIALRKANALPALEQWVASLDRKDPGFGQAALEALWIFESKGIARPELLQETLKDADPLVRAAAVSLIRFQSARLPQAAQWLDALSKDPHPRVRMAVVNVVAFLRPQHPGLEPITQNLATAPEPAVKQMVADLRFGIRPLKGRSVPVLEVAKNTRLRFWETGDKVFDAEAQWPAKTNGNGTYRTVLSLEEARTAILSVRHGALDLAVNGVQILSTETMWTSEQQAQVELGKGLNLIEITFRRLGSAPPPVFLYDTVGRRLERAALPETAEQLASLSASWKKEHPAESGVFTVRAVPNQLQFTPKELRVKAGQPVRLVFENPDLMLHNLVLVVPGTLEEVGQLADSMASQPDAQTKGFIPDSKKVLFATALVAPNGKAELQFVAPKEPGSYPYLCTFPGHWRIMQGHLVVEP